ncbi:MAG: hypothetical protein LEGION0398_MBIBDBAK_00408 [Legionellaceae bacterium]
MRGLEGLSLQFIPRPILYDEVTNSYAGFYPGKIVCPVSEERDFGFIYLEDKPSGIEPGSIILKYDSAFWLYIKTHIIKILASKDINDSKLKEEIIEIFTSNKKIIILKQNDENIEEKFINYINKITDNELEEFVNQIMNSQSIASFLTLKFYQDIKPTKYLTKQDYADLNNKDGVTVPHYRIRKTNTAQKFKNPNIKEAYVKIFSLIRQQTRTRNQENLNAIREVLATEIASQWGVKTHEQSLCFGTYPNNKLKIMTIAKWENNVEPLTKPEQIIITGGNYRYGNYLAWNTDPTIEYKSDNSIPELGEHIALFIILADPDCIGSKGDNKLKISKLKEKQDDFNSYELFYIDMGQSLRGVNPLIASFEDDFSINLPRLSPFKNFSILYDNLLSEKMKGIHILNKLCHGIEPSIDILNEYGKEFTQTLKNINKDSDLLVFDKYINKFNDNSNYIKYYAIKLKENKKNYISNRKKMLKKFQSRINLTPSLLNLIDNIEKLTSESFLYSPDGSVKLKHLRIEKGKRKLWQITSKNNNQEYTLMGEINRKEDLINYLEFLSSFKQDLFTYNDHFNDKTKEIIVYFDPEKLKTYSEMVYSQKEYQFSSTKDKLSLLTEKTNENLDLSFDSDFFSSQKISVSEKNSNNTQLKFKLKDNGKIIIDFNEQESIFLKFLFTEEFIIKYLYEDNHQLLNEKQNDNLLLSERISSLKKKKITVESPIVAIARHSIESARKSFRQSFSRLSKSFRQSSEQEKVDLSKYKIPYNYFNTTLLTEIREKAENTENRNSAESSLDKNLKTPEKNKKIAINSSNSVTSTETTIITPVTRKSTNCDTSSSTFNHSTQTRTDRTYVSATQSTPIFLDTLSPISSSFSATPESDKLYFFNGRKQTENSFLDSPNCILDLDINHKSISEIQNKVDEINHILNYVFVSQSTALIVLKEIRKIKSNFDHFLKDEIYFDEIKENINNIYVAIYKKKVELIFAYFSSINNFQSLLKEILKSTNILSDTQESLLTKKSFSMFKYKLTRYFNDKKINSIDEKLNLKVFLLQHPKIIDLVDEYIETLLSTFNDMKKKVEKETVKKIQIKNRVKQDKLECLQKRETQNTSSTIFQRVFKF